MCSTPQELCRWCGRTSRRQQQLQRDVDGQLAVVGAIDGSKGALAEPLDAAFVIGGKNSSNTYQLYRLCEQRLGKAAFFIQSETNIRSRDAIEHYVFPAKGPSGHSDGDTIEIHSLPPVSEGRPFRVLLTGGASCPDGIIQQVIHRINSLFPADALRPIDDVLADVEKTAARH